MAILEKNFNRRLTSKSNVSKKSKSSSKSKKAKAAEEEAAKKEAEEDAKSQGGKSAKSAKSVKSGKTEGDGGKTPGEGVTITTLDPGAEPTIKEKGWFTKQNIQNFLHLFISEKLPTEKMQLVIGHAYGKFITNLQPKPMALNEMRNMKEPNYSRLREVVRDPRLYGDPLLRKLCEGAESVGIAANSFHMVHEGFWDLYCKKPATPDLTSKKLDGWVNFVNLKLPSYDAPPEPTEEVEGAEPEPVEPAGPTIPVKAVARVIVPFKRPEPVEADDDEDLEASKEVDAKSQKSGKSGKKSE